MDITKNDKDVINFAKGSLPTNVSFGRKPKYIKPDVWMFLSHNKKVYASQIMTRSFSSVSNKNKKEGIVIIRNLRKGTEILMLVRD